MKPEKSAPAAVSAVDLDLFGAPIAQIRDRWGRPSYAKCKENQQLVATLKAAGWSQRRIARYLGCDEKTLRKHFSRELDAGADLIEGEALQVIVAKMRQGNLPAAKRILDLTADARPAPPPARPQPDQEPPEKLGKKDQLVADARAPSGRWGDLLPH